MDADVVRAVNDLTARWARSLPDGNTVVSGLGLWPLLAILATAADEPGRAELAEAAGVDASAGSQQALALIQAIDGSDDETRRLSGAAHIVLIELFDGVRDETNARAELAVLLAPRALAS